jgi:hypothetical protein
MASSLGLALELARVVSCEACEQGRNPVLLRDAAENLPQPGFIGASYESERVVLVGQNPGIRRPRTASLDEKYVAALRQVHDSPTDISYARLLQVAADFIPYWPLHQRHFPLKECGLSLNQIAYMNIVRCRTTDNRAPTQPLVRTCLRLHFERWLDFLSPRVVVFLGKWAFDRGRAVVERRGIPTDFVNRNRSLNRLERSENRERVASLVLASKREEARTADE